MELLKETEAAQLMDGPRARRDSEVSEHCDDTASDGEDEGGPSVLQTVASAGAAVASAEEAAEETADPSLNASDTAAAAAIAGLSLLETELLPAGEHQSQDSAETPPHGKVRQHKQRQKKQMQMPQPSEATNSRSGSTGSGNDEYEAAHEAEAETGSVDGLSAELNAQAESMLGR